MIPLNIHIVRLRVMSFPVPTKGLFLHSTHRSFRTCFSRNNNSQQPRQSGDGNSDGDGDGKDKNNTGDKFSIDWDKAWSSFKKQGKKSLISQFSPNKYVTWNPRRSDYPLSEEVDPIKRSERFNLMLWTSPQFTLTLAIVVVSLLLIYTILAPIK